MIKVALLLDSSRQFQETTSDLNHFACEETVLAGLRFLMQLLAERSSRLMERWSSVRRVHAVV
jgi:hypothetical protein